MKVNHQSYYNPKAIIESDPVEIITQGFIRINSVLKYLDEKNSSILEDYTLNLEKIFTKEAGDFQVKKIQFDLESLTTDFVLLNRFPRLKELVFLSMCKRLNLPKDYQKGQNKTKIILLNEMQARFHISFYRVRSFVDIMGREKGIEYWKKYVFDTMTEYTQNLEKEIFKPIKEKFSDIELENWGKIGSQDFTVVIYDENKAYMKINRCIVHEAFKEFNDSELSYLSYCYTGSVEDRMNNQTWRRKTPITLFQDRGFCIEFFYNNSVYPDAEPPSLETAIKETERT
ncbi:MAG: hypothetical protein ACFFDW_14615 [Candidatus Thorarchaeota archaeon]